MEKGIGYKLLEMNEKGELLPLFIDKNNPIPIGEWIHAKNCGKVNGFAQRPGFHVGTVCDAPWLKGYDGTNIGCYKPRFKHGKRVWCMVEYNTTHNYDEEVSQLPKKCFVDKVPENGYYLFREVGKGDWVITSDIKVVRILTEEERLNILKEFGYDEVEAYKKYKLAFEKRMKINA